jgi:hypothetical protein
VATQPTNKCQKGGLVPAGNGNGRPTHGSRHIPTLGEVLYWPAQEIRRLRVEFLNLLCATGLPDTSDLDIHACLKKLDEWTRQVGAETERCAGQFRRDPSDFNNSEAYFRVLVMITVLERDIGVRYNPDCIKTDLFLNSGEGFIHGLLQGEGGTCANMPVLHAAVGRKLGYPIYLCCAKGHVLCRWESPDGRERFNIDACGRGLSTLPDAYYMQWPMPIAESEVLRGHYLRNLEPAEELALFMTTRGHCLKDRGLHMDAIAAYGEAHRLAPAEPHHFGALMVAIDDEMRMHEQGQLPNSYRQWQDLNRFRQAKILRYVLKDAFRRIGKDRPPSHPEKAEKGPVE